MKVDVKTQFRTVTIQQWWFLAFVVLFALPFVIVIASHREVYDWYLVQFVEPELEQLLGFRLGEIPLVEPERSYVISAIVAVVPGGIFDKAGVREGDIPYGYVHGIRSGFVRHLHHRRGANVNLRFVNRIDADTGKWVPRDVPVFVPGKSAG